MAQVDDEIARLIADEGYHVAAHDDRLLVMERKNSWLAVMITAILAGVGGGGMSFQRTDRLYLDVASDFAVTLRLLPPQPEGAR